ncbi:SPW repeat-containing protein [Nocardiopsis sp. Huas11]|uniref:SPW repeat domain-containing protein n=1 Tax=Nocardiopsis sp. Huas11 TaxID=2183912 RepID=UPI000EB0BB9F|nr:SPW repeat protein [Nocardiopsis sp. Huas11]RKS05435.1 SPW repeat-containing protein [Nocardiopsis sp. Huas11]
MRKEARWTDVALVVVGLALALSYVWHGMLGFGGGAMLVLGVAAIVAAILSLTRPGAVSSEIAAIAIGVLAFILPWATSFTHEPVAAWSAWILGAVIAGVGVYGLVMATKARRRDPELAWTQHVTQM